jgi:hypothetical protein
MHKTTDLGQLSETSGRSRHHPCSVFDPDSPGQDRTEDSNSDDSQPAETEGNRTPTNTGQQNEEHKNKQRQQTRDNTTRKNKTGKAGEENHKNAKPKTNNKRRGEQQRRDDDGGRRTAGRRLGQGPTPYPPRDTLRAKGISQHAWHGPRRSTHDPRTTGQDDGDDGRQSRLEHTSLSSQHAHQISRARKHLSKTVFPSFDGAKVVSWFSDNPIHAAVP